MIIDKLISRIIELKNPTVVGLDPRLSYIPQFIQEDAFQEFGKTPQGVACCFYRFNCMIIDAIHDLIPAIKPQIAMYEQYGPAGIQAYIDTIQYAKKHNLIVIGDVKRGDIASTAEAYANGHIGRVCIDGQETEIFHQDFITLNPYMGQDSIEPYLDDCKTYDKGLFVLVKTSNPGSAQFQDLICDGQPLYERVGRMVSQWGEPLLGSYGFSRIGAVVGATYPQQGKILRAQMPHTFFLVPGYGAQGATAADLAGCFNEKGIGAIVNSSRGIIAAHQSKTYSGKYPERKFAGAAREAVLAMREDLQKVVNPQ